MFKRNKNVSNSENPAQKFGKELDFAAVEAYNLLRTNLSFALPDIEGGKVIGISSPAPQEGKSTASINLSYSLAEAGSKVILVDADMRRPSIAKNLKIERTPGLSNLLASPSVDAVHEKVLHDNMSVLPAGVIPPNPSELIGSEAMKHLTGELRKKYDYVIIDLPPVNLVSDAIAVSRYTDGIIIVVRHCHTKRREVSEAVRQLKLVDAKILGFLYNGVYVVKEHYR